jgi:molybdopterin synthase catalytic subunit
VTAPIDTAALLATVRSDASGAVSIFAGTVRNHHRGAAVDSLEYEAYGSMAEQEMRRIAAEACGRWELHGVAIVHRTGHLEVGEVSVAVAVSAAHRKESVEACAWTIDMVKERLPIWKREKGEAGIRWVLGDDSPGSAAGWLERRK